jgi:hypothetical protein
MATHLHPVLHGGKALVASLAAAAANVNSRGSGVTIKLPNQLAHSAGRGALL